MIVIFLSACLVLTVGLVNSAPLEVTQEEKDHIFSFGVGDMTADDPRELGEYFEGDMILDSKQIQALENALEVRNGLKDGAKRWPNRTVVYHINKDEFDEDQIMMIQEALAEIANNSCIEFSERQEDEHAVIIQSTGNGCFSSVGYSGSDKDGAMRQVLNLSKGCFRHGTIVHEMLHTIGFYHMQSTYDRDEFVEIVWENIVAGLEHNFAKYNNDTVTDYGVEYDYGSVMHYPETAFTKNGNKTIITLKDGADIGQRKKMSERDIIKLNKMYCDETETEMTFFRE